MRREIGEALAQAEGEREHTEQWLKQHGWWPLRTVDLAELPAGDYSFLFTEEHRNHLVEMQQHRDQLQSCLYPVLDARDIYVGKPNSLVIEWGDMEAEVVIELSLFGDLAAVFMYGDVPRSALRRIDEHLAACGLLRITDDEIEELQDMGVLYHIF